MSGSSGPGTSERVWMATRMSRVNTPEVVLGSRQGLFLPEGHPLLQTIDWSFQMFGVQGRCHELAFFTFFLLYFLNTYDPYVSRSYLINTTMLVSNHFAYSLCSQKNRKRVY